MQAGRESSSRSQQQQHLQLPPPPSRPQANYSNPLRQQGLHPIQWRHLPHSHQQRQLLRHYRQRLPPRLSLRLQSCPLPAQRRFFPLRMCSAGKPGR